MATAADEAKNVEEQAKSPIPAHPASNRTADALRALSGRQLELYDALTELDASLGRIYLTGASIAQGALPDATATAAHEYRELIEKLPRYTSLPETTIQPARTNLRAAAQELLRSWERAQSSSYFKNGGRTIDNSLIKFLGHARSFFERLRDEEPTRKSQARKAVRTITFGRRELPQHLYDAMVDEWLDFDRYFNNVSHHSRVVTAEEFAERASRLEDFLLDRLRPPTISSQQELDRIVEEAESDAKS